MSLKPGLQVVLLRTSSNADLQFSGRNLLATGAQRPINVDRIVSIKQEKYRAEVVQVVTVGANSYTPQASTRYEILIGDPLRRNSGGQETLRPFGYTTPADLTTIGANAAAQREFIHGQIVAKINLATTTLYVTAVSLGTGSGFTVTDSAGYYPAPGQYSPNRRGASLITSGQNPDGSGFNESQVNVTTAAVYSFGVGTKLLAYKLVVDAMNGNAISGDFTAPSNQDAVAGQNYDGFRIETLELSSIPTITGHQGFVPVETIIYVDNGTGAVTTNLAGFVSFERCFHRILTRYNGEPNPATIGEFFDSPTLFQSAAGAVPATTGLVKMVTEYGQLVYTQIGTQTITTPTPGNTGLILDQDLTATEGAEYTPTLLTNSPKEFVVGKTPISVFGRVVCGDYTDMAWLIGLRSKEANQADFNDYQNLAAVGSLAANGDLITTQGILANAATVSTSTAIAPVDTSDVVVEVIVSITGAVTCKLNDVVYPVYSVGTTPLVFAAGTILIPFLRAVNIGGGDPDMVAKELLAIPDDAWRV